MKKIFCFLFLYIIANLAAIAQQDPQFSFNRYTMLTVNPGFAGSSGLMNGIILNRYQWDGITGAPKTLIFSANGPSELFGINSGVGLNIISDELGFQNNVGVGASYAYRKKTIIGDLGIGISAGFYNYSVNGDWYIPESEFHGTINEPGIPQGETSQLALDFGFGIFLSSDKYFAGASITHLNQASIIFDEQARTYLARHYYLAAGYNITLSDPLFEIMPAFYFKTDMAAWQADLSVDVMYRKRFWTGLNYRFNDAIGIMLGFEMNNGLKIGYCYDIMTSALAGFGNGSHELFLAYSLDLGKNRNKKYKSIRYL